MTLYRTDENVILYSFFTSVLACTDDCFDLFSFFFFVCFFSPTKNKNNNNAKTEITGNPPWAQGTLPVFHILLSFHYLALVLRGLCEFSVISSFFFLVLSRVSFRLTNVREKLLKMDVFPSLTFTQHLSVLHKENNELI